MRSEKVWRCHVHRTKPCEVNSEAAQSARNRAQDKRIARSQIQEDLSNKE